MDERIRAKTGSRYATKNKPRLIGFEEALQEFMESAGLRCERNPETHGKTPDFLVWHGNNPLYVEAVCAQGPPAFEHKRGGGRFMSISLAGTHQRGPLRDLEL